MKIVLNKFETQLTARGFFNAFEQVYKVSDNMEDAYDKVVQYCIDHSLAVKYSSYISFKDAYYSFIKKRKQPEEVSFTH